MKNFTLGSDVFWLNNENTIERVTLKEYKLTINGGSYLVRTSKEEDVFISENELFDNKDDINPINLKDFFYIYPILDSDGLNGRRFPWSKQTYKYFSVYKVVGITDISIYTNDITLYLNIIPFGIIESKELTDLNIPISKIRKDSYFMEDDIIHSKAVIGFNSNLNKLFKKITYSKVNRNETSCKLVNGGGFSFDPAEKCINMNRLKYNSLLDDYIINSGIYTGNIFPSLYSCSGYYFDTINISNNKDYSINKNDNYKLITKVSSEKPKSINYKEMKNIECELTKEFTINFNSKIIEDFDVWNITNINPSQTLNIVDSLEKVMLKNERLEQTIVEYKKNIIQNSMLP